MTRNRLLQALLMLAAVAALALPAVAQQAAAPKGKKKTARAAAPNTLTAAEKAAGWQLLFDGKTLDGWRGLGLDAVPVAFVVEDGVIHKKTGVKNEADLITKKTYGNFELAFDWKISVAGNNGIKYNVSEELSQGKDKKGHASLGFEYQVLDDEKAADRLLPIHQCGSLYELIAPDNSKKALKPVGEWNSSKIVFNGNLIEHWLNGQKIVEAELGSPVMNEAIAKSKWKSIKDFGTRKTACIAITDHGDEAWYRNMKIRELPAK